ncbi:hypothetical protein ACKU27_23335 [Sphingobium yanoikuyae]|uniref:hypothetical protein n=1 Tax=Sphingobium yanoikuyae TaxID=13690 RepID=UPI003B91696F
MQLQDWLAREGLTYGQFGGAISRTAEAVRRYANGSRIPDRETMSFIVRETAGQVMPNDFYGLDCHDDTVSAEVACQSPGKTADFAAAQQSEAA